MDTPCMIINHYSVAKIQFLHEIKIFSASFLHEIKIFSILFLHEIKIFALYSIFPANKIDIKTYKIITKGNAKNLKMAKPVTAMMRKIHLTSLPFHVADFILNEKKCKLLTIMREKIIVMPRQAQ